MTDTAFARAVDAVSKMTGGMVGQCLYMDPKVNIDDIVRAVLAAIRTPDEATVEIARPIVDASDGSEFGARSKYAAIRADVWQAMIDTILTEGEGK